MWAKIVLNLLSNALKFTFDGRRSTVRVRGRRTAARELTVADTGIGIEPRRPGRGSSSASTASPARARAATRARASGWRWSPSWPSCTAARVAVRERAGRGQPLHACACRSAPRTCPPSRSIARPSATCRARQQAEGFLAEAMRWLGDEDGAAPPTRRRRARACWSSTTTPTCATTSPRCSPADYAVETAPDGAVALERARARPARPRPDRRDDAQPRRLRAAARRCRPTRRRPACR